ncbi:MAG: hypothetical protein EOM25_07375 [Deltaproteobacteria bacterium]|nr:hypothetical protein [Deltaproteobacteria bacterium]
MTGFDVVTSSDQGYAFFLSGLSWSVRRFLDKKLVVYDLGLKDTSKEGLDATFVPVRVKIPSYREMNAENCIRATHKPACILDWLSKTRRPFIFLDADCLVAAPFVFPMTQVGLTFKHYAEQTSEDFQKNGVINAGVMFFNPGQGKARANLERFIQNWLNRCERDAQITDQLAMSDLLIDEAGFVPGQWVCDWEGLKIGILPSEKYNDIRQKTGAVYHFKCAFRQEKKRESYFDDLDRLKNRYIGFRFSLILNRWALVVKKLVRPGKYRFRYVRAWAKYQAIRGRHIS